MAKRIYTKQEILKNAQKQFDHKQWQLEKSGMVVSYTDLRVELPAFKNCFGDTVVKVNAVYNDPYSKIDGQRVHVPVLLKDL